MRIISTICVALLTMSLIGSSVSFAAKRDPMVTKPQIDTLSIPCLDTEFVRTHQKSWEARNPKLKSKLALLGNQAIKANDLFMLIKYPDGSYEVWITKDGGKKICTAPTLSSVDIDFGALLPGNGKEAETN